MRETIVTDDGKEYSVDEIVHSTRIQKSATPKGTIDWYLKWIASVWSPYLCVAQDYQSFRFMICY